MISPAMARMMLSNVTSDPEILGAADIVLSADKVDFKPIERADFELFLSLSGKKCYHAIATKDGRTVEAFLIL